MRILRTCVKTEAGTRTTSGLLIGSKSKQQQQQHPANYIMAKCIHVSSDFQAAPRVVSKSKNVLDIGHFARLGAFNEDMLSKCI